MYNNVKGKLNPIATFISGALGYRCVNITLLVTDKYK